MSKITRIITCDVNLTFYEFFMWLKVVKMRYFYGIGQLATMCFHLCSFLLCKWHKRISLYIIFKYECIRLGVLGHFVP